MNLSITKLFQRDDGLEQAVSHLKRTVKKENRQVFPNDENPMDEEMDKAILTVFLICVGIGVAVAVALVVTVVMLTPHV